MAFSKLLSKPWMKTSRLRPGSLRSSITLWSNWPLPVFWMKVMAPIVSAVEVGVVDERRAVGDLVGVRRRRRRFRCSCRAGPAGRPGHGLSRNEPLPACQASCPRVVLLQYDHCCRASVRKVTALLPERGPQARSCSCGGARLQSRVICQATKDRATGVARQQAMSGPGGPRSGKSIKTEARPGCRSGGRRRSRCARRSAGRPRHRA